MFKYEPFPATLRLRKGEWLMRILAGTHWNRVVGKRKMARLNMGVRFGPAGIPLGAIGGNIEGLNYASSLGLDAYEVEFVRGVNMKKEYAGEMRKAAEYENVSLSIHAPYYINCCALEKGKIETANRNLMESARIAHVLNAKPVVFHPGFYLKRPAPICAKQAKETIEKIVQQCESEKLNVLFGLETTGKHTAFGTVEEIVQLCREVPHTAIVIDFAHIFARSGTRKKGEYLKIFEYAEKQLGIRFFHCHFSEIERNRGGEKSHLALGTNNEPDFNEVAEAIIESGFDFTIISESPALEQDALKMKGVYEERVTEKRKT